jgi:hypothetical protein
MGNTCFFNSALQVVASIDLFVAAIERIALPPDHTGDSYCLAFLKLFIPAIAEQSSQPNTVLNISSVRSGGLPMGYADWMDFVLRLTRQYDPQYTLGDCADPGDLLDHISSLIPEIGQLCTTEFRWSTTFPCACGETTRESTVREQGITVPITGRKSLDHHILCVFQPEAVSGFLCDKCKTKSCDKCPAVRQRSLLSLPRFLKINITAPRTPTGLPIDYHQHGPLQEYERLDLSDLVLPPQPKPVHYTLRAAIMYSKRHHWAYLHDQPPIFVSDATSRVATPGDVGLVARCARTLVYERTVPAEAAVIRMAVEQQTLRNQQTADAQPTAAGAEVQTTTAQ